MEFRDRFDETAILQKQRQAVPAKDREGHTRNVSASDSRRLHQHVDGSAGGGRAFVCRGSAGCSIVHRGQVRGEDQHLGVRGTVRVQHPPKHHPVCGILSESFQLLRGRPLGGPSSPSEGRTHGRKHPAARRPTRSRAARVLHPPNSHSRIGRVTIFV